MKRRKFIKLTGGYSLLLSAAGPISCVNWSQNETEEAIKKRAIAAFRRFEEVWDFNDFWKRGNTFDACLVFADAFLHQWPDEPEAKEMQLAVKKMLEGNLAYFKGFDPGGFWADDFGWWGLMALNARKHLLEMGEKELAREYLVLSTDLCWEFKKNTAYDHATTALPVPHGCRNGDAHGNIGVKNTVTNVLLFLLSSRIYKMALNEDLPEKDRYLDMAYRQWRWFDQWFELEEYEYLKKVGNSGALVQERPVAFFEGSDYQDTTRPPWSEGWVWTGDQGMLIGALTDMLEIKEELSSWIEANGIDDQFDTGKFENKIRHLIAQIGKGIEKALVGAEDKIIREAPFYSSFGPVHGNDYLAGRGIMMRYLGSKMESHLMGVDLGKNILATVDAIWATREESNNQFQPEFTAIENDEKHVEKFRELWGLADDVFKWDIKTMDEKQRDGVCQSIGLDALGAAIKLL